MYKLLRPLQYVRHKLLLKLQKRTVHRKFSGMHPTADNIQRTRIYHIL